MTSSTLRHTYMVSQNVLPPELRTASPSAQLEYLRFRRAGIARVIAILETLAAARNEGEEREESAA